MWVVETEVWGGVVGGELGEVGEGGVGESGELGRWGYFGRWVT